MDHGVKIDTESLNPTYNWVEVSNFWPFMYFSFNIGIARGIR